MEDDYTLEPSVESNHEDRSLAVASYSEIALKQHVITAPPVVQNRREQDLSQNSQAIKQHDDTVPVATQNNLDQDLSQNAPALMQDITMAVAISQNHEKPDKFQIPECFPTNLIEADMGPTPTKTSHESAAEVFASENVPQPLDGIAPILEGIQSGPELEIATAYFDADEVIASVDVVHGQALDAALSVDLVTDIIFGELLEEIDFCSNIITSQIVSCSEEHEEAHIENLDFEIDDPVSYHALPLTQEDTKSILREWISAFVPDSKDGFTQKPIMQDSLLTHTIQNLPEQSPRFEEICLLFDMAEEIMSAIFLPFEIKKERKPCAPYLSLSSLSKEALLAQIMAKVLETWEYVEVHDQNLDDCLIQNVKVEEKGWANLSHSMQTEIVNQVTNALFEELVQDTSRITVALTGKSGRTFPFF